MYVVEATKRYQKSLRKHISRKEFDEDALNKVIDILASGGDLSHKYKDHQLKGNFSEYRECHIKHDLLLIYRRDDEVLVLVLVDVGTHHQLFGK
jgi:mRNA interferase YafQ